jgi:transposase
MTTSESITGGVDTHKDFHVVAAVDQVGRTLGTATFENTAQGHAKTVCWLASLGLIEVVGVEGTGSYGAGLMRHLRRKGISVIEVVRPNRERRRRLGKTDTVDAVMNAALSVLNGVAAPGLLGLAGVGVQTASCLLGAAGDNPERLASEASFASLCGVSPIEASSGRTTRHRLNRGGSRQANSALWWVVITRLQIDPATKAYAARRGAEGKRKAEIIRCLKRYVAREVYRHMPRLQQTKKVLDVT